jgi:hypothetical protein
MIAVEWTYYGECWRLKQELLREAAHIFAGDDFDARQDVIKSRHVSIEQFGFANVTHPRARVFLPQHHGATQLAFGAREFCITKSILGDLLQSRSTEVNNRVCFSGKASGVHT